MKRKRNKTADLRRAEAGHKRALPLLFNEHALTMNSMFNVAQSYIVNGQNTGTDGHTRAFAVGAGQVAVNAFFSVAPVRTLQFESVVGITPGAGGVRNDMRENRWWRQNEAFRCKSIH